MSHFMFIILVVTWNGVCFTAVGSYMVCPSICTCKWKGGKQNAECVGQRLQFIPIGVDGGTQVIDLSRNRIETLPSRVFQSTGLVNLQKIFLTDCGITTIAKDAFFQLSNLVELDLSRNKLKQIPSKPLKDSPHLRRLQLASNPIKNIEAGSLSSMAHLNFLDLSDCQIKDLQPGAFVGLPKLQYLKLDGNRLSTLSVPVVEPLTQLSGLHLHNNPWVCDCRLRDVRNWMLKQNVPLVVPPHCAVPKPSTSWDAMSLEDFACAPVITAPKSRELVIHVGQNVTVTCDVYSVPRASVTWEFGGKYLSNMSSNPEDRGKYTVEVETDPNSQIQTSRLTLINPVESDSDMYTCFAENRAGTNFMNVTISVIIPLPSDNAWTTLQITAISVSVILVLIIAAGITCLVVFRPVSLPTSTKFTSAEFWRHFRLRKPESVELTDVTEKEEKDVMDKNNPNENGSSEYGSDQLTPDLVSKIGDATNHGSSHSTSSSGGQTDEHEGPSMTEGYGPISETWMFHSAKLGKHETTLGKAVFSEIFTNPCYGKDDPECYSMSHSEFHGERFLPQNDRVRTLRAGLECSVPTSCADGIRDDLYVGTTGLWKKSPHAAANHGSNYSLPSKARFSPDEGYAEEGLDGTEV